jgi:hypothetical protein
MLKGLNKTTELGTSKLEGGSNQIHARNWLSSHAYFELINCREKVKDFIVQWTVDFSEQTTLRNG